MAKNSHSHTNYCRDPNKVSVYIFHPISTKFYEQKMALQMSQLWPKSKLSLVKICGMSLKATPATVWLSLGSLGLTPGNAHFISTYGLPCPSKSWNHTVCTEIDRCVTVMVIFLSQAPWYVGYGTIGMVWYGDVWCEMQWFKTACTDFFDDSRDWSLVLKIPKRRIWRNACAHPFQTR